MRAPANEFASNHHRRILNDHRPPCHHRHHPSIDGNPAVDNYGEVNQFKTGDHRAIDHRNDDARTDNRGSPNHDPPYVDPSEHDPSKHGSSEHAPTNPPNPPNGSNGSDAADHCAVGDAANGPSSHPIKLGAGCTSGRIFDDLTSVTGFGHSRTDTRR